MSCEWPPKRIRASVKYPHVSVPAIALAALVKFWIVFLVSAMWNTHTRAPTLCMVAHGSSSSRSQKMKGNGKNGVGAKPAYGSKSLAPPYLLPK